MCGIAGIINFDNKIADIAVLKKMSDTLSHRGPEEEGFYILGNIGLAHRRLKIVDLSGKAKQPMTNEDGSMLIVYNGEVYNYLELKDELAQKGHKFRSHSDTEVILHSYEEWGVECAGHFIGMWAFAIWDGRRKMLFACRDNLGIKPFYYFYDKGSFIFASEIKAILESYPGERRAEIQSIYEYLYLGYPLEDRTWIKGILRLNPAHYLIVSNGNLSIYRYWKAETEPDYSIPEGEAVSELNKLFLDSVKLTLRSDVEVGAHLSGGIDSSSIALAASSLTPQKPRTFSGVFDEGREFDETSYINEVIEQCGAVNNKVTIKPENFLDNLRKIIWHLDEPTAGPGAYPQFFVSKLINSCGLKVVLGGQGGDELFGGYPYYYSGILTSIRIASRLHKNINYRRYYKTKDNRLIFLLANLRRFFSRSLSLRKRRIDRMLNKDILKQVNLEGLEEKIGFYKGSFEGMELWDVNNYLPALLQVEDRLGMAFSVETRLPLLNRKIVEYALKLPFYFKINNFNSKYVFRQAMKGLLPKAVFERRDKMGFRTPIKAWFQNLELREAASLEIKANSRRVFNNNDLSWERLNIGIWLDTFKISL